MWVGELLKAFKIWNLLMGINSLGDRFITVNTTGAVFQSLPVWNQRDNNIYIIVIFRAHTMNVVWNMEVK